MSKLSPINCRLVGPRAILSRPRPQIFPNNLSNNLAELSLSRRRKNKRQIPRGVPVQITRTPYFPENTVALPVDNLAKYSERHKYMTAQELKDLGPNAPLERLAGRLALKEALLQHLGFSEKERPRRYKSIRIFNDQTGKPHLVFDKRMLKILRNRGVHSVLFSISHTNLSALAYLETRIDTAGIGCDIERKNRLDLDDRVFLNITFTPRERYIVEKLSGGHFKMDRKGLYTRLWAGKEAVAKALGTGVENPTGIRMTDIEILLHVDEEVQDGPKKLVTTVVLDAYKKEQDRLKRRKTKRPNYCSRILKNLGASHIDIITDHGDQHAAAWVRLVLKGKPLEMAQQAQTIVPARIRTKGRKPKITMVFADCVGIGENDPNINPIATIPKEMNSIELLSHYLDEFSEDSPVKEANISFLPKPLHVVPLQVTSPDVSGFPASNTNQVSLYTGVDIASILGKYADGFPDHRTIGILTRDNILRHLSRMGAKVYSANAFPPWFLDTMWKRNIFASAMTGLTRFKTTPECKNILFNQQEDRDIMEDPDSLWPPEIVIGPGSPMNASSYMIRSIGQRPPSLLDVIDGQALFNGMAMARYKHLIDFSSWGIPNDKIPDWEFDEAGRVLAEISKKHHFTLFSTTITDWASHKDASEKMMWAGHWTIHGLSQFLQGLMQNVNPRDSLVILATDHGGIEDIRKGHTSNPGMFLAYGRYANQVSERVRLLTDVVPALMGIFT